MNGADAWLSRARIGLLIPVLVLQWQTLFPVAQTSLPTAGKVAFVVLQLVLGLLPFALWALISWLWKRPVVHLVSGFLLVIMEFMARLVWLPSGGEAAFSFAALRWPMLQILFTWSFGLYLGAQLETFGQKHPKP